MLTTSEIKDAFIIQFFFLIFLTNYFFYSKFKLILLQTLISFLISFHFPSLPSLNFPVLFFSPLPSHVLLLTSVSPPLFFSPFLSLISFLSLLSPRLLSSHLILLSSLLHCYVMTWVFSPVLYMHIRYNTVKYDLCVCISSPCYFSFSVEKHLAFPNYTWLWSHFLK